MPSRASSPSSPSTRSCYRISRVTAPTSKKVRTRIDTSTGNVGFIFTNGDLKEIRDKILANKVAAPARAGAIAPLDVWVPAGNTGMEPGKTSFFQALGVPTKIARGTIEITSDLKLVEKDAKVGASEATLLNMLNISPFSYGMKVQQVYEEGQTFEPHVLDISPEALLKTLTTAITTIATISLATNFPTLPSIMHSLVNGYKKVLAVAVETDYSWEGIESLKDRIANPDAYAAAAPAAGTGAAAAADDAPAAAAKEESEAEESGEEGKHSSGPSTSGPPANILQASAVSSTKGSTTTSSRYPLRFVFRITTKLQPRGYEDRLLARHSDNDHDVKRQHTTAHTLLRLICRNSGTSPRSAKDPLRRW